MPPALLFYTMALVVAGGISLAVSGFSWLRRNSPGARVFTFANLCAFFYAIGSIFEIHSTSAHMAMAALSLEYLGIAFLGPLWFLSIYEMAEDTRPFPRWVYGLLFVIPVVIVIAVLTNDIHHWYYSSIVLERRGPFSVPIFGKGPLYILNLIYLNTGIFLGTLLALQKWLHSSKGKRLSAFLLLAGSFPPWFGMFFYQLGFSPYGLDTAPFGLSLSSLIFALALYQFRLFDVVPLAYELVFTSLKQGVLVIDNKNRLVGLNPAMQALEILSLRQEIGKPLTQSIQVCPALAEILMGIRHEIEVDSPTGRQWFLVEQSTLRDQAGHSLGRTFIFTDITKQHSLTDGLTVLARTDELTGLHNRRSFLEILALEWKREKRYSGELSLIMFDIDHFKEVNDGFGHEAGDLALQHVVALCRASLRDLDTLARYGGEEFIILLPQTCHNHALKIAERMRISLAAKPLEYQGKTISLQASFGVAGLRPDLPDPAAFIRLADDALYQAKAQGRNRVVGAGL